jgi:hypothetical protein
MVWTGIETAAGGTVTPGPCRRRADTREALALESRLQRVANGADGGGALQNATAVAMTRTPDQLSGAGGAARAAGYLQTAATWQARPPSSYSSRSDYLFGDRWRVHATARRRDTSGCALPERRKLLKLLRLLGGSRARGPHATLGEQPRRRCSTRPLLRRNLAVRAWAGAGSALRPLGRSLLQGRPARLGADTSRGGGAARTRRRVEEVAPRMLHRAALHRGSRSCIDASLTCSRTSPRQRARRPRLNPVK